ncbi:response regulator [Fischerella thermalis CCMEE 5330]|uniref:Response regulator n=1 Tax=Fischerella thermalis CCMEE 5330 TaxID=2019670 RepID=A0A2N6MIE6_9CYAN|nr:MULTISPECIES: response regulator [Fischerella]PMB46529.1 response regulator [Fischerella thermalis CCMEE 5330]BAU08651.1 response regulator receiver protein [Fischerella sp. NIES-3754]BCX11035.1 MAG: two-component system response regulator [Fischerella sp.]
MNNYGTFTNLHPLSLLRQLSNCSDSTCLQALSNSVTWSIFIDQGKITFATHSIEPFDRLERHLRRLSHRIPTLTSEIRVQLRLLFEPDSYNQSIEYHSLNSEESISHQRPAEYQAICWLFSQKHLNPTQAAVLIQELAKEVIESFLLIKQGNYELKENPERMPIICRLDVGKLIERCQGRLQDWQSFAPHISSPYQRPYLRVKTLSSQTNLPEIQQNITEWIKGFSLRHLAVIINQDEIHVLKTLYPYILNGSILLHEPDPPFDKLPKTFEQVIENDHTNTLKNKELIDISSIENSNTKSQENSQKLAQITQARRKKLQELTSPINVNPTLKQATPAPANIRKKYKIVSIDDSPTFLKEISRFLEEENFSVVTISDPLKAVMAVIRHKPDLILLDLNMEGIDGYELCRIIRNNSMFKETPIVMVTGSKGIIDKVRARFVGASGYLTKPFTRADLLKMVFMHLT